MTRREVDKSALHFLALWETLYCIEGRDHVVHCLLEQGWTDSMALSTYLYESATRSAGVHYYQNSFDEQCQQNA